MASKVSAKELERNACLIAGDSYLFITMEFYWIVAENI